MTELARALRRAVATFLFATLGTVSTLSIFDTDVATWKIIVGTGVGALVNLVYRWSEAVLKEPEPIDLPGGPV
jgi:hypothetical protein